MQGLTFVSSIYCSESVHAHFSSDLPIVILLSANTGDTPPRSTVRQFDQRLSTMVGFVLILVSLQPTFSVVALTVYVMRQTNRRTPPILLTTLVQIFFVVEVFGDKLLADASSNKPTLTFRATVGQVPTPSKK